MTNSEHPNTTPVDKPKTPTLSLDAVFDLMSNEHRRRILYYFHEQSQAIATVDELVTHLHKQFDARSAGDADRLKTQLIHGHLPKLENHGVLEYDERSETVRYWDESGIERLVSYAKFAETSV